MACDRLHGVLVAQQKVVPDEKFADLVSGEGGRRVGFESQGICLSPYKNIRDGQIPQLKRAISSVSWQRRKVLCASIEPILGVFLYGKLLWCGHVVTVSNRDCDSLSLGSIPSGHPKEVLVVWRRRMRTGFISPGGWIDTNYNHQGPLFQRIECHASNLAMWVRFLQDRPVDKQRYCCYNAVCSLKSS